MCLPIRQYSYTNRNNRFWNAGVGKSESIKVTVTLQYLPTLSDWVWLWLCLYLFDIAYLSSFKKTKWLSPLLQRRSYSKWSRRMLCRNCLVLQYLTLLLLDVLCTYLCYISKVFNITIIFNDTRQLGPRLQKWFTFLPVLPTYLLGKLCCVGLPVIPTS